MKRGAALLLALCALAGCGLGAGEPPGGVTLTVTQDFGTGRLVAQPQPDFAGGETVMRLLQRNAKVRTRYGGSFVQAIDGRAGGRAEGRPVDWFFYVNGIESSKGAADVRVHDGDRVWWDRHDWGAAMRVPAVIGSYPEPFLHGTDGKRLPVRTECAKGATEACRAVARGLRDAGVGVVGNAPPGATSGPDTLRVLVGVWPALRRDATAARIELGPKVSGVYARPSADGRTIVALDPRGRAAQRIGPGAGLVAATAVEGEQPTWIVTGTDPVGLASAARAFAGGESTLGDKFALAINDDRALAVPLVGRRQ